MITANWIYLPVHEKRTFVCVLRGLHFCSAMIRLAVAMQSMGIRCSTASAMFPFVRLPGSVRCLALGCARLTLPLAQHRFFAKSTSKRPQGREQELTKEEKVRASNLARSWFHFCFIAAGLVVRVQARRVLIPQQDRIGVSCVCVYASM